MLRVLFKKQFLETNAFIFQNKKTGKNRSVAGLIGYILLMVVIFGFLALMFGGLGLLLGQLLSLPGYEWIYYAVMGIAALLLGCFGSVFNTYASLYQAKDNELLLSMPIKPSYILITRLFGVFLMSLLYSSLVWVPSIAAGWFLSGQGVIEFSAAAIIAQLCMTLVISVLVTALSCVLGWVVALISGKLKNKSLITVIVSLAFLAAYYMLIGKMEDALTSILGAPDVLGSAVRGKLYPLYMLGRGCTGSIPHALGFAAIAAALYAVCHLVMSRSFITLATMKSGVKKVEYRSKVLKSSGAAKALFSRELRCFLSNPTYMLNTGLGFILMPAAGIYALLNRSAIRAFLPLISMELPFISGMLPVALATVICMVLSMDVVSAPSVSLEGNTLWLIRTMPVSTFDILKAKLRLHTVLNAVPGFAACVMLAIVFELKPADTLLMIVLCQLYNYFCAELGLILNILRPNLSWTSAAVAIKQSSPVFFTLFGGWLLSLLMGAGCYLLRDYLGCTAYMAALIAVIAVLCFVFRRWLKTKGCERFSDL